jgi:hypothetical protein
MQHFGGIMHLTNKPALPSADSADARRFTGLYRRQSASSAVKTPIVCQRHNPAFSKKPLAAGTEWATFLLPLRTGAPFFLLKDGLTGRRQKQTVCTPARFLLAHGPFPANSNFPIFRAPDQV